MYVNNKKFLCKLEKQFSQNTSVDNSLKMNTNYCKDTNFVLFILVFLVFELSIIAPSTIGLWTIAILDFLSLRF